MSQVYVGNGSGGSGSTYYSLTPYIVGPDIHSQYSTIGAAITAAVAAGASFTAPANIYIKPQSGGYIEDPVLQDGINLVGFNEETVIIGKITYSGSGHSTVTGLGLETNNDFCISLTGANGVGLRFYNCRIRATNNTAIELTNTNSSELSFFHCEGDLFITGITLFSQSGNSTLRFFHCVMTNEDNSTTASTNNSAGTTDTTIESCFFNIPITTSNNGFLQLFNSTLNSTIIIDGVSGDDQILNTSINSGASSAVSIGAGATCTIANSNFQSSATNVLTGSGTLQYGMIVFTGSSSGTNVTTQTPLATLL